MSTSYLQNNIIVNTLDSHNKWWITESLSIKQNGLCKAFSFRRYLEGI